MDFTVSDADGLQHANVEIEARIISPFMFERFVL